MRHALTVAAIAAAALLTGAGAKPEPGSSPMHPATMDICLDVDGSSKPPLCQGASSRLDQSYDICICRTAQRVEAPVCRDGEKPQSENRAFEKARKAAATDGSLVGDLYDGKPMCVRARQDYR